MGTRGRNLSLRKSTHTNGVDIQTQARGTYYDLQSQARRTNQVKGGFSNRLPSGLKEGDMLARFGENGSIQLGVSDARGDMRLIDIPPTFAQIPEGLDQYIDLQIGVVPPVLANVPNDGDFGQYYDSNTSALYWIRNIGGSLVLLNFLGFSGTISDTQHGDRSTTTTNMHKFPQITGTITDAQHGNLSGGTLHSNATGATAGFMSSDDKTKLDNAVSTATASRLVIRDASAGAAFDGISCTVVANSGQYNCSGSRVVTARQTGWTNWTGTASRASHATYTAPVIGAAYSQAQVQAIADSLQDVTRAMFALLTDLGSTSGHGLINA